MSVIGGRAENICSFRVFLSLTHLRHSRQLIVLSEIHTDWLDLVAIESIHADRSGPDGRRRVDVQGEIRHLDPSRSSRPAPYTLDVDVRRRALRKHFVDTVDLYIGGTRGWSTAEADTRNWRPLP
jgi:hypothetical protein